MRLIRILLWTAGMLFITPFCMGQTTGKPHNLQIGEQCPDFNFGNIIRYKKTTAKLSDFRGRLVILDFWATWCGPCRDALPKLDSLQHQFGNKIVIMPVSNEPQATVEAFFKSFKPLSLPSVTGDTLLQRYFRHNLIPHEVIIDTTGKVLSILNAEDITVKSIERLLQGQTGNIRQKKDFLDRDFLNSPLLVGGLGATYKFDKHSLYYSSVLTGYIDGLVSFSTGPNLYGAVAKIICTNASVARLYETAFGTKHNPYYGPRDSNFYMRTSARTLFEVKDSALRFKLYYWPGRSKQSWKSIPDSDKLFNYEIILPRKDSANLNRFAVEDLNRYFKMRYGLTGRVEKRNVECWALTVIDGKKIPVSNGGKSDITIDDLNNKIILQNYRIHDFVFWMLFQTLYGVPEPIIDDTHFDKPIDLTVSANPKDLNSVNKALAPYGLQFVRQQKKLDMIVISDQ